MSGEEDLIRTLLASGGKPDGIAVMIDRGLAAEILKCAECCFSEGQGGNIEQLLIPIARAWPDLAEKYAWIYDTFIGPFSELPDGHNSEK